METWCCHRSGRPTTSRRCTPTRTAASPRTSWARSSRATFTFEQVQPEVFSVSILFFLRNPQSFFEQSTSSTGLKGHPVHNFHFFNLKVQLVFFLKCLAWAATSSAATRVSCKDQLNLPSFPRQHTYFKALS